MSVRRSLPSPLDAVHASPPAPKTRYRLPSLRDSCWLQCAHRRVGVILAWGVPRPEITGHIPSTLSSIGPTTLPASTPRQLRCLIIDDNPQFLDAARRLLQQEGITVVGVGASSDDAIRLADQQRPDVTLVDIELGEEDGITVTRRLAQLETAPAGKLILISTHAADEFADLVATSPAIGFVPKSALSAQAIYALTDADRERHP